MNESTKTPNPSKPENWNDMTDGEQITSLKNAITSATTNESVRDELLNPATAKDTVAREGNVTFDEDVKVVVYENRDAAKKVIEFYLPAEGDAVDTDKQWLCTYVKYSQPNSTPSNS